MTRIILAALAMLVALHHADATAPSLTTDPKPPNVIVILADDLGYSDLGCYGSEIPTPHIDALAGDGVRFTQMYNSARCCPSRASLMTGLYPSQAGIGDFTTNKPSPTRGPGYIGRLNDRCVTLAEALKTAGYGCYYVGKWHMHEATGPIARGFDEFYGYTRGHSHDQYDADYYIRLPEGRDKEIDPPAEQFYATDVFNRYAIEFLRQGQQSGRPYFLFLGHSSPHFPVQAPAERADAFEAVYRQGWDVLRQQRFEKMKSIGLIDGDHWQMSPRSIVPVDRDDIANGYSGQPNPAWDSLPSDRQADLARRMAVFAAMVSGVDQGVGKIVEHLKQTGDFENTLILFLSDNGACYEWGPFGFDGTSRKGTTTLRTGDDLREIGQPGTHQSYGSAWANLGNTPFRLYKHFTHEGGISTPLIAHWPAGIGKPDRWIRQPAHVMDIMPTLLDATGVQYPNTINGKRRLPPEGTSLLPAMTGESLPERTIGFDHQGAHAIRQGSWKAVWSKRMPDEIQWELYDLSSDRCEMNDVASQYPDKLRTMTEDWTAWARRVGVIWDNPKGSETQPDPADASPSIAGRPIYIQAVIDANSPRGVVLAQGGNQYGYALHFDDGIAMLDVRLKGQVTRLKSSHRVSGTVKLSASLTADQMTLTVNDQPATSGSSPGLIPIQPVDALSIGFDERTSAGDYAAPNKFNGTVVSHKITTGERKPDDEADSHAEVDTSKFTPKRFGDVSKPMFVDPNYHGSCDPEIVFNPSSQEWLIYYTARRATRQQASYVGTPIGVLASKDFKRWTFRGYCTFDGRKGQPDNPDTHWAPGIIVDGNQIHMFATYKASAMPPWGGDGVIRHYVAPLSDPIDGWKLVGVPNFHQPDPIDVSLLKMGDRFHAYYRVGKGGGIQWATSEDLLHWQNHGPCPGDVNADNRGFGYQEAPYVFRFADRFWMLTDPHDGLAVFHSDDAITWHQQERILLKPGFGPADGTRARHPSVAVRDGRAFIFYHTEPNRPYPTPPAEKRTPTQKISFLQIAELQINDGRLTCDRNADIRLQTER
ncbi:sulfatase-like hydrolase/transferase [Crateriforma spongiae]|uniref:sulfatase-like hydrolase/transferase n=1 Tax=Crateriforma spongiae TaxID=2724528 RepID=UPI0039AF1CB5